MTHLRSFRVYTDVISFHRSTRSLSMGLLVLLCILGSRLGAQDARPAPPPAPAELPVPATDIARYVAALNADSLRGRATPSPALERAARSVAEAFRRLGLQPGVPTADDTTWLQRYPLPGQQRFDPVQSALRFRAPLVSGTGQPVVEEHGWSVIRKAQLSFATAVHFAPEPGPPVVPQTVWRSLVGNPFIGRARTVVLAGQHTVASLQGTPLRSRLENAVVVYVPPAGLDRAARRQVVASLAATACCVIVVEPDAARFAAAQQAARGQVIPLLDDYLRAPTGGRPWRWAVEVGAATIAPLLAAGGLDLAQPGADTAPMVRELPKAEWWLQPEADTAVTLVTAPNVVAVLEGTDSVLKHQYVLLAAPLDGGDAEPRPGRAVASQNEDDHASGVAGLLGLAEAFSRPGARPRRSLILLATSGSVRDTAVGRAAWGSNFFAFHQRGFSRSIVAGLLLDHLGTAAGDSVWLEGADDAEWAPSPSWTANSHTELGLVLRNGGSGLRPASAYYALGRHGIPGLALRTGQAANPPASAAAPASGGGSGGMAVPFNAEQAARTVSLAFYLGQALANADRPPRWSAGGRQRLMEAQEPEQ